MSKRTWWLMTVLLALVIMVFAFELIRDAGREGDFKGYVEAGHQLMEDGLIYKNWLNTWPPFFSVFSVLLAFGDEVSSYGVRLLWILGSMISFFIVVKKFAGSLLGRSIGLKAGIGKIQWQHPVLVVPILLSLRFLMDEFSNVQINLYMMLLTVMSYMYFIKGRNWLAGLLLAFAISLKVYPVFLLFYFLFKREFKLSGFTIGFVVLFNAVSFVVYGYDVALANYHQWITEIAPQSVMANYRNQSVFGMLLRFLTSEHNGDLHGVSIPVNVVSIEALAVKRLTYLALFVAALWPGWLMRKRISAQSTKTCMMEFAIVLTAIPLLSPVSWKSYFVFLWAGYFVCFLYLFKQKNRLANAKRNFLRVLFFVSIAGCTFSTEAIVGPRISDVLEAYSVITIGALCLLVCQILILQWVKQVDAVQPETS